MTLVEDLCFQISVSDHKRDRRKVILSVEQERAMSNDIRQLQRS